MYVTITQDNLNIHIQSVHEGVRFFCNQCEYKATHQSSLTTNIQLVHEGVRYICNQSGYKAGYSSNLTTHIQSHTVVAAAGRVND